MNYINENNIKFEDTDIQTVFTFNDFFDRLRLIALSMFEWVNLPPGISERYVEQKLLDRGFITFFKDETLGYMALQSTMSDQLNAYEEPTAYQICAINYNNKTVKADESVLIRDNYLMRPFITFITEFSKRLTDTQISADININAQRTPFVFIGTDKEMLSLKNMYHDIKRGEPAIFSDKALDLNQIKTLPTIAPFVADKILIYQNKLWQQAMTLLGVNNSNTDKKERLITAEVNDNDYNTAFSLESRLLCRKQACEQINKMYNLNIDIKVRDFIPNSQKPNTPKKEEKENE